MGHARKNHLMNLSRTYIAVIGAVLATTGLAQAQTYSEQALADLRFMIEEEKLAGDVYRVFGDLYPTLSPFQNIRQSEDTHFNTLVKQADLIGLDISELTSLSAGQYVSTDLQSLYQNLVADGSTSSFAALTVGKNVELKDIEDLTLAMSGVPDTSSLYTAYGSLLKGSNNHLVTFNYWLSITPLPPVPEPATYSMMLVGLGMMRALSRHSGRTSAPVQTA